MATASHGFSQLVAQRGFSSSSHHFFFFYFLRRGALHCIVSSFVERDMMFPRPAKDGRAPWAATSAGQACIHRKWRRKAPETCPRCGAQRMHAGVQRGARPTIVRWVCISQCSVDLLVTSYGLFHISGATAYRPGLFLVLGPSEIAPRGKPEMEAVQRWARSRVREPGTRPRRCVRSCVFPVETDGTACAMVWCTGGCTDRTAARADDAR
jgi:hypothetical protein